MDELGDFPYKGIAEPVKVYQVSPYSGFHVWSCCGRWSPWTSPSASSPSSAPARSGRAGGFGALAIGWLAQGGGEMKKASVPETV